MKTRKKNRYSYFWGYGIIGFISTFICLAFNKLDGYEFLFLIPLTYSIASLLFYFSLIKNSNEEVFGFVFILFNFAIFLKYAITPLSMIIQEYYSSWGAGYGQWGPTPPKATLFQGIIIESIEVIFVFLTLHLIKTKNLKKIKKRINSESSDILFKNRIFILVFCALALLYILIVDPNALSLKSLFNAEVSERASLEHAGIITVCKQVLVISVFLLTIDAIYKKVKLNVNMKIIMSLFVLALYLSLNMSMSRWGLVFSAISGCYLLNYYYGKFVKKYIIFVFGVVGIGFISISLLKFSYAISSDASISKIIGMLFGQMQDYFSGPRLVAQSIEVAKQYHNEIGISTIFNDLIGNVPLLSSFADQGNRINRYFCHYNFGNWNNASLLMPMVGEGYCYIPIFPWFLSIFYTWIAMIFDFNCFKSKYIEYRYLYLLEGCWLSFSLCLNSQTNLGHLIEVFFCTLIIFSCNRKVSIHI